MDRTLSIIAGTAVLSGALVLLGWFSLPVRVVVLVGVVLLICRRGGFYPRPSEREGVKPSPTTYLAIIAITVAALLILHASAATNPIRSPWSIMPSAFFALYALLVGTTAILAFRGSRAATLGIACAIAVGSAVALLVYPIGFGFDHFIHAAAERIIVDTGALTPRPFFYSAHYGLVSLIATLGVPVAIADRLLAPLLTVFLLVPLAVRTLTPRGALALLLIPFLSLAVSTPQATANVFALCTILHLIASPNATHAPFGHSTLIRHSSFVIRHFLLPLAAQGSAVSQTRHRLARLASRNSKQLLLLVASTLSNPLTGIPLLGAVAATLFARARHRTLAVFSAMGGVVGIPLALLIATRTNTALDLHIGFSLAPLYAAVASIRDALSFSAADFSTADALAITHVALPIAWIVLAMFGAIVIQRVRGAGLFTFYFLLLPSVPLLSALLISLTTTLSSQLPEEQSQLPLRLLSLAVILSVPLVGRAVSQISNLKSQITSAAAALVLATLATFTLLLSYPRDDAQARSGLWSVSADDIAAVHAITTDAGDERFVVLSNQMLAAAAIREFGFRPSYRACSNGLSPSVVGVGDTEACPPVCESASLRRGVLVSGQMSDVGCAEHLAFPLPAGGPLAQHFWSYISQQEILQKCTVVQNCRNARTPIDAAMRLVAADRAYIVLHAYWRNYDRLTTATAAIADAEVGNLQNLRIFRFVATTP